MSPDSDQVEPFEAIIAEYEALIFGVVLRHVSDREVALDLTRETFLTAKTAYPDLRGEPAVRTWILRIALNQCKDHFRRLPRDVDAS